MKFLLALLLLAQSVLGASITFTWSASTGTIAGYKLYQSGNGGVTFVPILTNVTTTVTLSNLVQGVTYQHYVTAFNQDAESAPSNVSTNRIPFTAPSAPQNLTPTVISVTRIDLIWQDMASNESGFRIERTKGSSNDFALIATLPANTLSYIDNSLKPRRSYCYRLYAFNEAGNSTYAGPACERTFNH
jgi:fibronectin type 3 domain-containing protein